MKFLTKIKRDHISLFLIAMSIVIATIALLRTCNSERFVNFNAENEELKNKEPEYLFGICIDSLNVTTGEVESGETMSTILNKHGIDAVAIEKVVSCSKGVFDLRDFRQGNRYTVFTAMDSTQRLQHFVYEHNVKDYIKISFVGDSVTVLKEQKQVVTKRRRGESVINSSLWNAAIEGGMNGSVAMSLADVFEWKIDFYGIQKDDEFKVIYDELYIDGKSVGVGKIYGAWFKHAGKEYYAIRHEYTEGDVKVSGFWDSKGQSLRNAFLKAPLKYSRISSRFTNSRLHPVLRIRRPHHGVDYAAPSGTPVRTIANGTVTLCQRSGGAGNYIKIKHARGYETGYMHLKGYAKGIRKGVTVRQGDIIGYVGSTGVSTGPHLDFRLWLNKKPIDPLKNIDSRGEDIAKKHKAAFTESCNKIMAELNGKFVETADTTGTPVNTPVIKPTDNGQKNTAPKSKK